MPVTLTLPTVLAALADGQRTIATDGRTLAEVVGDVTTRYPALGPRLRGADGEPYAFVTIYVNDEDSRLAGGFAAPVADGDEIVVVPAIAGG